MPFNVKKRPGPFQSVAAGFMTGMSQGAKKGLQLMMEKQLRDKEEQDKKITLVTELLEKTAKNVNDPTVVADIDKLRFDIATGVKPISEAYSFMQRLSPEAYVKIDFSKQGASIEKRNDSIAKAKARQEQKTALSPAEKKLAAFEAHLEKQAAADYVTVDEYIDTDPEKEKIIAYRQSLRDAVDKEKGIVADSGQSLSETTSVPSKMSFDLPEINTPAPVESVQQQTKPVIQEFQDAKTGEIVPFQLVGNQWIRL